MTDLGEGAWNMKEFYVYIMASRSGVLYTGMTNDLERRVAQHKAQETPGFTAKYNVTLLVFYETFPTALQAIAAEKKIKGWRREKKIKLIESQNATWRDLSEDWPTPVIPRSVSDEGPRDHESRSTSQDPSSLTLLGTMHAREK
jgi:putative endonuclease